MKVCRIEYFPGDKIECRNCSNVYWSERFKVNYCGYIAKTYNILNRVVPSEGCREDCPWIPCEGIRSVLIEYAGIMETEYSRREDALDVNSIKFIKACEDNQ